MKTYLIWLSGCDDETEFEMELTDEQYQLITILCDKSKTVSTYHCMPTMSIKLKS